MSPLILHSDDLVLYTFYMLPSEFIFEKKIYYMSEMSAFKNFIMIEDEKVVQYLRSTFYYLLFRTAKMQLEKKIFFVIFDEMKQQQRQQMVCHVKSLLRQIDSKTETGLRQQISITKIRDRIFFPLVEEVT